METPGLLKWDSRLLVKFYWSVIDKPRLAIDEISDTIASTALAFRCNSFFI